MSFATGKRWALRLAGALVLLAAAAVALPAVAVAPADSSASPTVDFTPVPSSPLHGGATFTAYAAAPTGQTIGSVEFYYRPAGEGNNAWVPFAAGTPVPGQANQYSGFFDPSGLPNGGVGVYDFQVLVTDTDGSSASAVASDVTEAGAGTYVAIANPGSTVAGTVTLTATPEVGGNTPDTVTFLYCPTSDDCPANPQNWKQLATVTVNPSGRYVTTLDTSDTNAFPPGDGTYDFAVSAEDNSISGLNDAFQGGAVSGVVVDNTKPTVTLDNPGASLSGQSATLTATPQDAGSGVASVKFEVAPAGSGNWTTVGVASSPPYSASFDTRQFADGSYDIRAEAVDNAGNHSDPLPASIATGVSISNPGALPFGGLAVTDYLPPTFNNHLLGELPGPEHETWAIGQTNAPAPVVDGQTLSYTMQGKGQWVLIRFTEDSGWQIVDVLRNDDGSTFTPNGSLNVSGAMTASGEAWIMVTDRFLVSGQSVAVPGVFHRPPGGHFEYDQAATTTLTPLFPGTLRLGETADGAVYGMLASTGGADPPHQQTGVPSPNGPVSVTTKLEYAQLENGQWNLVGFDPKKGSGLPPSYTAPGSNTTVSIDAADVTGPGTGWAALEQSQGTVGHAMILARFDQGVWTFLPQTGLDALDLTGAFAPGSQQSVDAGQIASVKPLALRADGSGVWLSARVGDGTVVARYDAASGGVVDSWCAGLDRSSSGCGATLDLDHPAVVPDAVFGTSDGPVAQALGTDFIDVYFRGAWTSVAAPGFKPASQDPPGSSTFVDPADGWLVGANTLARVSASTIPSPLASWPEANRNPLLSVALPPGQSTTDTPGALAVGLNGTALHYDASAGWQVDATPPQTHHIQLTGVAFAGPSLAFAVGQEGTILRWNGSSWGADPQSLRVTTKSLNAVAFGSDGQGWAVGALGTILHYDGTAWSPEQIDGQDAGANVTSVAVAGQNVYAIVAGNLIVRSPGGAWNRVAFPSSPSLPLPPPTGSLTLVSGLPDGGIAVAGKSLLMVKQSASSGFAYSSQSFTGIPVALAAFRDPSGDLRAFLSVAPPIQTVAGLSDADGGFPAGDGDLIVETNGGWQDLSRDLPAASLPYAQGDGVVQPDPVLAVAAAPDGSHAWVVGGYAGTHAADGIGTDQVLQARPADWLTSAIWRYDAAGSASSPATAPANVSLPATRNVVSFAYFSSALCKVQCSATQSAQPDVNLSTAATQIAAFAQQPGGPAFAMLGGNARASMFPPGGSLEGSDPVDLAHLPRLLSPLSGVPTYAAYGPGDSVPASADPALPWAQAFGNAPAPFGPGAAPAGVTPQGSGDPTGLVNKYYAFDVSQNGGTLRAIVLDNSGGSLDAGQMDWLNGELTQAQAAGLPIVVFAAEPLNSSYLGAPTDADAVAARLAAAGVLAVFTTSSALTGPTQLDQISQVPANAAPGAPQIPEYEGATLTYQQPKNNGVLWYDVSVDTAAGTVSVKGIPVISSLALDPLNGLSAARSSTLSFQAIGRRPPGTIATTPIDQAFPGYGQYVGIPSSTCSGCIGPSYSFTSSNPVVGDFVVPSAPGSSFPKLSADGATTHSSSSGLFCAFNTGTTTVTVTSGLLASSLPVTVAAGGFGPPCGTVPGGTNANVIRENGGIRPQGGALSGLSGPAIPVQPTHVTPTLPHIVIPHAPGVAPAPAAAPTPAPVHASFPAPNSPFVPSFLLSNSTLPVTAIVPPVIPPAVTTVPPGGASASAQAQARREEKARRHAQSSAYVIRPAGTSATEWFYPAVAGVSLITLLLIGGGVRPRPRTRPALAEVRYSTRPRRRARR